MYKAMNAKLSCVLDPSYESRQTQGLWSGCGPSLSPLRAPATASFCTPLMLAQQASGSSDVGAFSDSSQPGGSPLRGAIDIYKATLILPITAPQDMNGGSSGLVQAVGGSAHACIRVRGEGAAAPLVIGYPHSYCLQPASGRSCPCTFPS